MQALFAVLDPFKTISVQTLIGLYTVYTLCRHLMGFYLMDRLVDHLDILFIDYENSIYHVYGDISIAYSVL